MSGKLHPSAQCFAGLVEGQPAVFVAVLPFPHPTHPGWREHRCVCLPDFQGVGIGNAMSEFVASLFVGTGKPYTSVTSHPAMIHHRARSPHWIMSRAPSRKRPGNAGRKLGWLDNTVSRKRMTASFAYVGDHDASLRGSLQSEPQMAQPTWTEPIRQWALIGATDLRYLRIADHRRTKACGEIRRHGREVRASRRI